MVSDVDVQVSNYSKAGSSLDKSLFFIVLGLGSIGIVGAKYLGISQLIATAWPVTLMILYAAYMHYYKRFQLREDIAGDNLYYLGFLYTLTSLAYALYLFTSREGGGTEAIVSNFGIALATTIFGLSLRVVFYQMRTDPMEVEREARLQLSEAASRLKAELNLVVQDMATFRVSMQQVVREGMEAAGKKASEEISKIGDRVRQVSEDVVKKVEKAFDTLPETAAEVERATGQVVRAIEDLTEKIKAISAPKDLLEKKLEPAVEGINEVVDTLKESAKEDQKQVRKLVKLLENTIKSAQVLDDRVALLNKQTEPLEKIVRSVFEMGEGIVRINQEIEQGAITIREAAKREGEAISGTWKKIRADAEEGIQGLISELRRQAVILDKALLQAYDTLKEHLGKARESVDQEVQTVQTLVKGLEETFKGIDRHNEELQQQLDRSRQLTSKVQQALSSMVELLIEKLEPDKDKEVPKPALWSDSGSDLPSGRR